MLEFVATFCTGVFFGAAAYVTIVQHPAALAAGSGTAGRFFPPMYARAAPLQAGLAVMGAACALVAGLVGSGGTWVLGALLLSGVVPFTLVRIRPVNELLLAPDRDPDAEDTKALLQRWGALHAVRTGLSGLAYVIFLVS